MIRSFPCHVDGVGTYRFGKRDGFPLTPHVEPNTDPLKLPCSVTSTEVETIVFYLHNLLGRRVLLAVDVGVDFTQCL